MAVRLYAEAGLKAAVVRPFNIYGPGQTGPYAGVITKFVERAKRRDPPVIFGDGTQTRDFIHVRDVAEFIKTLLERKAEGIYNVGSGQSISIIELARLVMRLAGLDGDPIYAAPRLGDIKHSRADIRKATSLGWRPQVTLEQGLKELLTGQHSYL